MIKGKNTQAKLNIRKRRSHRVLATGLISRKRLTQAAYVNMTS